MKNAIVLGLDPGIANKEGYVLTTTPEGISINGQTENGVFYGIQTLRKSIPAGAKGATVLIPAGEIKDEPRFSYRGMHLDVGRHFFPKEFIKKYIDLLALHNMNTFHWHLTEDQGWRIEIKKYPKLTEIGSQRSRFSRIPGKNLHKILKNKSAAAVPIKRYLVMLSSILLSCVLMPRRFRFFFSIKPLDSRLQSSQAHNRFPISAFLFHRKTAIIPIGTRKSNFRRQNKEDSMTYKTKGTCSTMIDIEMEPDQHTIKSVAFTGGCNGNLKGISSLVVGMKAEDAIARLKGIKCGFKPTSCPDQLARALEEIVQAQ